MTTTPFDQLVHRVNNLLGTIEIQAEVARGGSLASYDEALDRIVESAHRVRDDVRRLRAEIGTAGAPPPEAHG